MNTLWTTVKARAVYRGCAVTMLLVILSLPDPAWSAFLLLDAPETVLVAHDFEVDVYVYNASDLYGVATDIVYTENLVDIIDQNLLTQGIQPLVTEGEFLNQSGTIPTIFRSALQNGQEEGVLVLGVTRSGNVPGRSTGGTPAVIMTAHYQAKEVGTATFSPEMRGLVTSTGTLIPIDVATGVNVQILPFTNTAPLIPANPYPTDAATEVLIDLSLGWTGGDPDAEDIVTYSVYLDETNPPTTLAATVVFNWDQTACTTAVQLDYAKTYYWYVVAKDKFGEVEVQGPVWSFTTMAQPPTATPLPPTITPTPLPPTPTSEPTVTPACINNGDVTQDNGITAADAQRAFNIALGYYIPNYVEECAADCNGDGDVTAGDGQAIFMAALGMGSCVDPLGGNMAADVSPKEVKPGAALDQATVSSESKTLQLLFAEGSSLKAGCQGELLTVDIVVQATTSPLDAFTMDLGFCADMLTLVSCEEGDLNPGWIEFGCNETAAGVARIAAFGLQEAVPVGSSGTLAHITFKVTCEVCAPNDRCHLNFVEVYDDVADATVQGATFTYRCEQEATTTNR